MMGMNINIVATKISENFDKNDEKFQNKLIVLTLPGLGTFGRVFQANHLLFICEFCNYITTSQLTPHNFPIFFHIRGGKNDKPFIQIELCLYFLLQFTILIFSYRS